MEKPRSKWSLVFRPQGEERNLPFMTRWRFGSLGANGVTAVTAESHPGFHASLSEVGERMGMAMPNIYIWESAKPVANAVAMPGNPPAIAFSRKITELLTTEELAAVTGHELGHVKNFRRSGNLIWLSAFGAMAMGEMVGRPLQRAINGQIAAKGSAPHLEMARSAVFLARMSFPMFGIAAATRNEEYAADVHGAHAMQGDGVPLMSALQKLQDYHDSHRKPEGLASQLLAPLRKLLRSHPDYAERRDALGVRQEQVAAYRAAEEAATPIHAAGDATSPAHARSWEARVTENAAQKSPSFTR